MDIGSDQHELQRKAKVREISIRTRRVRTDGSFAKGELSKDTMRSQTENSILNHPLASDLLLQLFIASLSSYKRSTLCNPFPSCFVNKDGEKDFGYLVSH